MRKTTVLLLACLLPVSIAQAIENFLVKDIRVEGLQRIAPGTVFNYLPVKVGDTLTDGSARDAIAALFKTGFFQDVRLERSGDVLVVQVKERPSIDSIQINGTKDIDEKTLLKSLKEIGLAEGLVFNSSLLDKTELELKRQYFSRGRYAVSMKTTVTPLERNRVAIRIDVSEGEVTKIRGITIVGNHLYNDDVLRKTFTLSVSTMFSIFSKNDQYSKQQLSADLESLRNFYQNQGYLDFAIDSTQVSITPDKQDIYITVNLTEGRKYFVTDVKLGGKLIVSETELRSLIGVFPGSVFSRQEVTDSSKRISDRLGNDGYAFANVNAVPDINREKNTVAFTFFIDPGQRVYVRRVNFSGNLATNDEVLRREMRQLEGAWFSTAKVQRSRIRLQRLGFFEDVNIETPPVPGSPDQVDINVSVKERLVNNFMFGIGYSTDGLVLNASMNFKNTLGTGQELALALDTSKVNKHVNLGFTDPYFTDDGISRTINFYSTRVNTATTGAASYSSDTDGIGFAFGIPISEDNTLRLGLAYERIALTVPISGSLVAQEFVSTYGPDNSVIKASFGWAHNTLDSPIFPTSGALQTVSFEFTLPGMDLDYFRIGYSAGMYVPLNKTFTYKILGGIDFGAGYGNNNNVYPFYKNFYAGGSSSVRGYAARSLGPTDVGGPNPSLTIGGVKKLLANTELLFPLPGMEDNKAMRLSAFIDGGMVYGPDQIARLSEMRFAAGVAFNWLSPVGPISLSYAIPLNDLPGDKIEAVQFTLGQSFR